MGREDDAAGVAAPVLDVERGVVFGQVGVARIAEDAFDEIEIADETGGTKKRVSMDLAGCDACGGADDGAQQQSDEQADLVAAGSR